ncbi:MAG: ferritin-like domain-containing protein [Polyangiaceae bacterium]|nr:ferritin-like domain-containing protein [Polyangiaceae bacterium]
MTQATRRARVERWGSTIVAGLVTLPVAGCGEASSIPCDNPQPVVIDGVDTGFETCDDGGWTHRPAAVECAITAPRPDFQCSAALGCQTDDDCADTPFGHCVNDDFGDGCFCASGCATDADCSAGFICICGGVTGSCVRSSCTDDASCGDALLCASYVTDPGCGGLAFQCQSPDDECASDADCGESAQCSSDGTKKLCRPIDCAIGRPFVVDGEERLADAETREDWAATDLQPRLEGLDRDTRAKLAAYWTDIGRMEHASIAAFARFALQLLSLGAPPELVSRTQSAMVDETRHARFAFALASAYAGEALGPGALAMDRALSDASLESVLATVITEGCVGETVAAMEAKEALERVEDPALRFVLREITRDESEHAVLAWRSVAWLLEAHGPRAAAVVRESLGALRASLACGPVPAASAEDERLLARGYVGASVRAELRRHAIDRVIAPALEAMLDGDPAPTSVDGGRRTLV